MDVRPFKVRIPEDTLNDPREHLSRTGLPDEIPNSGWDYGSNLDYIRELADYRQSEFDCQKQETAINAFSHFRAGVNGIGIHFIHERGKGPDTLPLIITHGWPSSFSEMHKIIPLLADPAAHGGDPADSFDVVVPSLPGYGFSDRPTSGGMTIFKVAELWAELMIKGMGNQRFGAQGGDWGASCTARLGFTHPENVVGVHVTMVGGAGVSPYRGPGSRQLTDAEQALLAERDQCRLEESGYSHVQWIKPQSLSCGLNDSPVGLAGWIVEKYRSYSDCDGDVERSFTKDELLTNITIYWVTQTINPANRIYYEAQRHPWEAQRHPWNFGPTESVAVPSAIANFPQEINHPPGSGPNGFSTSSVGPRCRGAAISRRRKSRTYWSRTSGNSSGRCVRPVSGYAIAFVRFDDIAAP